MTLNLTQGQKDVLRLAETGHNVCVIGKAGVGKTTVVRDNKKNSTKGKQCYVVCSSGVSCEAYDGVATTIHSRYGLQTCELPATLLVERTLKRNNIVDLIGEMDILIWVYQFTNRSCSTKHFLIASN